MIIDDESTDYPLNGITWLMPSVIYISLYLLKDSNHNASSSVLARIIAVESTGDSTAYRVINAMNVAAYVVVGKWITTPMSANGNINALTSSQESAVIIKIVVTNISQTAHQLSVSRRAIWELKVPCRVIPLASRPTWKKGKQKMSLNASYCL